MDDALPYNDDTLMDYLDGEMSQAERSAFELQLQGDAALNERLLNLKLAIAAVQQYGTQEKVQSIHSEMMQELRLPENAARPAPVRTLLRYGMAAAASIILIVVALNIFNTRPNAGKLYDQAYVDYDASATRGGNSATGLQKKYEEHQYAGVVSEAGSGSLSAQDSLLIGLSYLKTGQLQSAIQWLQRIPGGSKYSADAQFYLSLAYLKNKNYSEALRLMQAIHDNPAHIYHAQFSDDYLEKIRELARQ